MAKLYANSDGKIIRVLCTSREEEMYPDPPEDSVYVIELDQYENENLLRDMSACQQDYSIVNTTLYKSGSSIPISPDGETYQAEKTVTILKERMLAGASLTAQELSILLKYLFTRLGVR